jgi:hypothetical protein
MSPGREPVRQVRFGCRSIADVEKSVDVDESEDKPIRGLPEARKRPRAFGTPSITEFLATISRHRDSSTEPKARRSKAKK